MNMKIINPATEEAIAEVVEDTQATAEEKYRRLKAERKALLERTRPAAVDEVKR